MSASQSAGYRFVPLMARIVLCLAFVPAGWSKIMTTATFQGAQAQKLIELGVAKPSPTAAAVSPAAFVTVQDAGQQPPAGAVEEVAGQAGEALEEAIDELPEVPQDAVPSEPDPDVVVEVKSLHGVTLMIAGKHPQLGEYAPYLAWTAALTELVGGLLLFVGLLARVWGLGLAFAMVVAFYLTSLDPFIASMGFMKNFGESIPDFNRTFAQLGLFVLAFGVFLTGPGMFSFDSALFGRSDQRYEPGGGDVKPAD